jgi:putative Mg2+ transporter-C (MgtC) family protein
VLLGTCCRVIGATSFSVDGEAVVRLLVAAVLGAFVGVEREMTDQPAGLRTHIAVAVGAALFGVISTLGFQEFDRPRAESTMQADVTRVASNVVVGIGFLGAGVIFRQGSTIKNLTTAASLWAVAAIGLAAGIGNPTTGAVATLVLLASLVVLRPLRGAIRGRWSTRSTIVQVRLVPTADPVRFLEHIRRPGVDTPALTIGKQDGHAVVRATVTAHPAALERWMADLVASDAVEAVTEV